jgi:hypothetical protein
VTRRQGLVLAVAYVVSVVGGIYAGRLLSDATAIDLRPINEPEVHRWIMGSTAAFVLAAAVPFVPGAEIGFALMVAFGARIVPLVYLGMLLALLLAYLVGRLIPAQATAAAFGFLGLARARDLVLRLAPLGVEARLEMLIARAPRHALPFLLRHRYLALAVALNLPGNTLLGGGGGIALAAGMSGIYPFGAYLATIALAIAPVPALFLAFGAGG